MSVPTIISISLRPTCPPTDDRELCLTTKEGAHLVFRLTLGQLATIGEACNEIIYCKLGRYLKPLRAAGIQTEESK